MKRVYFTYVLITTVVLSSCTATLNLPVLKPAEIQLPKSAKRFGIINEVNEFNSPERIKGMNNSNNSNIITANSAVLGIIQTLATTDSLRALAITDSLVRNMHGQLMIEKLDSFAIKEQLSGYIVLEEVKTTLPLGGTLLASAMGQTSARVDGSLTLSVQLADSSKAYRGLAIKHHNSIPLTGNLSIQDIFMDKERKRVFYTGLGLDLGNKAAQLITPMWIWLERTYYTKGNDALKNAKPMIFDGNWDAAEKLLLADNAYEKEKVRSRVLFNLALINEGQGDLPSAINYIDRAIDEGGGEICRVYQEILEKRRFEEMTAE